jgi:hypothetical protein
MLKEIEVIETRTRTTVVQVEVPDDWKDVITPAQINRRALLVAETRPDYDWSNTRLHYTMKSPMTPETQALADELRYRKRRGY